MRRYHRTGIEHPTASRLSIHRSMPDWLPSLLQLFWNHHVFSRGKQSGQSPMQLAGIEDTPTLTSVFDNLFADPAWA